MSPEQNVIIWARGMIGCEFVWGETDCAMLSLKGLEILTGEDYAARYRGKWSTQQEAIDHYRTELPSQVLESFGGQRVPGTFAVLGDVVIVPGEAWPEQMHFVLGAKSLSSRPSNGVGLVTTRELTDLPDAVVWRVAQCLKPSH